MPRYGQRSDPQTHAAEILMMASVGWMIFGVSPFSKRTSRGPYRTAPCMTLLRLLNDFVLNHNFRCQHLWRALAGRANLLAKGATFFERDVQLIGGNPNRCSEKFVMRTQLLQTDRDQSRITGKPELISR